MLIKLVEPLHSPHMTHSGVCSFTLQLNPSNCCFPDHQFLSSSVLRQTATVATTLGGVPFPTSCDLEKHIFTFVKSSLIEL